MRSAGGRCRCRQRVETSGVPSPTTSLAARRSRASRPGSWRKDGSEFDAAVACAPLRDKPGGPGGFVGVIEDISDRKRTERELRRSEAYLAEAQGLSRTGCFGWSVGSGEIYWSDEAYRIFGCDRARRPTVELVLERTHPEDRSFVRETIAGAQRRQQGFDVEHRC